MAAKKSGRPWIFYGWINVGIFFIMSLVTWGPQYSFGVFFKPLAEEFGWGRGETSGAMTLSLIVGGSVGSLGGWLSDRYGPRKVMSGCGILIGAGYLLLAHLGAAWQLYLWYGLVIGLGMSTAYIVPAATASRWFVARRGLGLGITLMGMSASQILIPPLVALAIGFMGWRNTYTWIGVSVLVVVLFLASFLRKAPEDYGLHPDGKESAPVSAAGSGGAAMEGFTLKQCVRFPAFWLIFGLWILLSLPVFVTLVQVVPLATDVHVGKLEAAVILSVIGISGIGGRFIFGYMSDRWGGRTSAATGMGLVAFAMVAMMFAGSAMSFYVIAVFFGLGYTGGDTALVKLSGDFFGRRYIGAVMGLLGLGWRIGASIGALVGGIIFDLTQKYQVSFAVGAFCATLGLALVFVVFRLKPRMETKRAG